MIERVWIQLTKTINIDSKMILWELKKKSCWRSKAAWDDLQLFESLWSKQCWIMCNKKRIHQNQDPKGHKVAHLAGQRPISYSPYAYVCYYLLYILVSLKLYPRKICASKICFHFQPPTFSVGAYIDENFWKPTGTGNGTKKGVNPKCTFTLIFTFSLRKSLKLTILHGWE